MSKKEMDSIYIPDNVKRIAKANGLKTADIERACFVSVGYLSRVKKDRVRGVSTDTLIQLSKVLDVTIEELVTEPPEYTNADKFFDVFGIMPKTICDADNSGWWEMPYERGEKE